MSLTFCPKCSVPRPMNLSTTEQEITGPDEQLIKVVTETYHCAVCHSFVRSESTHKPLSEDRGEATKPASARPSN